MDTKKKTAVSWIEIWEDGDDCKEFVYKTKYCLLDVAIRRDEFGYWESKYAPISIWTKMEGLPLDTDIEVAKLRVIQYVDTQLQTLARISKGTVEAYKAEVEASQKQN